MWVNHWQKASDDLPLEYLIDEEMRLHALELRPLEANAILRVKISELDRVSFELFFMYPFTHVLIMHRLETI